MKATATLIDETTARVTLPRPHFEENATNSNGYNSLGAGNWITALYSAPRTGRKFVRTYSIWGRRDGQRVGTQFREIDESEYLRLCERVGVDPVHVHAVEG